MPFIPFDELKRSFTIEQVAGLLGLTLKRSGDQLRGECPACGSGGPRTLVVTPRKVNKDGSHGAYYCWAEHKGGDLIQLVAHVRKTDPKGAAAWLTRDSRDSDTVPDRGTVPRTDGERGFKPLDYLEPEHEAVTEGIGFSVEIAKELGIGFAPKGVLRGTVAVPIRDETGVLRGYIGITEATLPGSFRPVSALKRA